MYTFIVDPSNNKKYNINSKEAKRLLKNFIKSYVGGAEISETEIDKRELEQMMINKTKYLVKSKLNYELNEHRAVFFLLLLK